MWWGDRHILRLIYILHPPHHSCIWPCGGLSSLSKCSSHYQFDKSNIYRKISRQNLYFQKTRFLYHLQLIVSYHIRLRPAEPTLGLLSPSLTLVLHRRSSTVFSGLMSLTLLCMRAEFRDEGHPPLPQINLVITLTLTGMCFGGGQWVWFSEEGKRRQPAKTGCSEEGKRSFCLWSQIQTTGQEDAGCKGLQPWPCVRLLPRVIGSISPHSKLEKTTELSSNLDSRALLKL